MILRDFIKNFVTEVNANILQLAQTELSNENKKLTLDHAIFEYVETAINGLSINFILKIALRKLLLPNISTITQIIFDLLKAKIEGITK